MKILNSTYSYITLIIAILACLLFLFSNTAISKEKPIQLNFAYWSSPKARTSQLIQQMLDRIEEKSQGRIKFNAYFGETLLKISESYRGVQRGVADMSYFGPNIPNSPLVLGKIISLPFIGVNSNVMATETYQELFNRSAEVRNEYKGIKVLGIGGIPMDHLHLTQTQVRVPSDMVGKKIITLGARVKFLKAIGATPITMGVGEWYTSLERGLAEGLYFLYPAIPIFKLEKQFKHHTVLNGTATIVMFIFNEKKWNSLPSDLQEVITEATQWRSTKAHNRDSLEEEKTIADLKKRGHTIYTPTAQEILLWEKSAKPVHEEWIKNAESRGLPGRKIYNLFKDIIVKYGETNKE